MRGQVFLATVYHKYRGNEGMKRSQRQTSRPGIHRAFMVFAVVIAAERSWSAEVFYLLTRRGSAGDYQYAVQCHTPDGTLIKAVDLPAEWDRSSDCSALASDGQSVWVAHDYDRETIHGIPFWGGSPPADVNYQHSEPPTYGFGNGLAYHDGKLYLVREHPDPGTDRIERYRLSDGAYLGRWETAPQSVMPWSAQAAAGSLFVLDGGDGGVVVFDLADGSYDRAFPVSGAGPLCGNATHVWIRTVDNVTWNAYTLAGARRPAEDVEIPFQGTVRDAYIAGGPDIAPSTGALDFGLVQEGNTSRRQFSVRNRGNNLLTVNGITLPDASLSSTTSFPVELSPGESAEIEVAFSPSAGTSLESAISIQSSDPVAPDLPILLSGSGASARFYVAKDNPAAGDGRSWNTAFASIQDALTHPEVLNGAEIWVQGGHYNLSGKLIIDKELSLYGGFSGTESTRSQRDWSANETLVDGGNANVCFDIRTNGTVDGFTVQKGRPQKYVPGGGFSLRDGIITIANCRITDNEARLQGSAIGTEYGSSVDAIMIRNCVITGNSGYDTTVIYSTADRVLVEGSQIRDNLPGSSLAPGGAIRCDNGATSLIVRDSLISGHTGVKMGGGIAAEDVATITIENSIIRENTADSNRGGGGIHITSSGVESSVTILDSVLSGNAAPEGGGIWFNGGDVEIRNCTISGNRASGTDGAGALLVASGDLLLENTVVTENEAPGRGAGLALFAETGTITLDAVQLAANHGATEGGGAHLFADRITMTNCLVADNSAASRGGGIYVSQQYSGIEVTGCTIANNLLTGSGLGAGIYVRQGGGHTFYNSIARGNRDSGSPRDGLQLYGSVLTTVEYSNVEDSWFGSRPTCINADPKFADADGPDNDAATWQDNDYRLYETSPSVDAGDSTDPRAPGDDLEGNFRPQDGNQDGLSRHNMGCYESVMEVPLSSISGTVFYSGPQSGQVVVQAFNQPDFSGSPEASFRAATPPAAYELVGLAPGEYFVRAFRDANADDDLNRGEPAGVYEAARQTAITVPPAQTGTNITLTDPDNDSDNIADWWEYEHFDGLEQDDEDDPDNDGRQNLAEFAGGTDPNGWRFAFEADDPDHSRLVLGYEVGASDSGDDPEDQPFAPGGAFDLRFDTAQDPLSVDIRGPADKAVWHFSVQPVVAAARTSFLLSWSAPDVPPERLMLLDEVTSERQVVEDGPRIDMAVTDSLALQSTETRYFRIRFVARDTQSVTLHEGWNAVSLWVKPESTSIDDVFQGLNRGQAFRWEGTYYQPTANVVPLNGITVYRNRGAGSVRIEVSGKPLLYDEKQLAMTSGWNHIGVGESIPCPGDPPLSTPPWLYYRETYRQVPAGDMLMRGSAYWIYIESGPRVLNTAAYR